MVGLVRSAFMQFIGYVIQPSFCDLGPQSTTSEADGLKDSGFDAVCIVNMGTCWAYLTGAGGDLVK